MAIRLEDIQLASSGNHLYPLIKATDATRLRVQSSNGYVDIGSGTSSSWGYILTDRANFYVDKGVHFDGNIQGYGGDETASFATYYDRNNTSYYLNPADYSVLNGITMYTAGATDTGSVHLGRGAFITFYGNSNSHHGIGSRDTNGNLTDDLRINSYHNVHINLDSNNNNGTSDTVFTIGHHGQGTGTVANTAFSVTGGGIATATSDMRAPIFYDSDDTTYFLNPGMGQMRLGVTNNFSAIETKGSGGYLSLRVTDGGHSDGWGWSFTDQDVSATSFTTYLRVNYNGTATSSSVVAAGSFKAPIFYDSNDTGRYANPAGTSSFGTIHMNNNNLTNVNHITFNDAGAGEGLEWLNGNGWKIYESPDDQSNAGGNLQFVTSSTRKGTLTTAGTLELFGGGVGSSYDNVAKVLYPKGATYTESTNNVTGAIKITLPQSWTNTMMTIHVSIFDYSSNESFDLILSGYNYTGDGGYWTNCTSQAIAHPQQNKSFNIRYGHDGTKCCIFIGETSSTWSYPKVVVTKFMGGHGNYQFSKWDDGWDITRETSLASNIDITQVAYQQNRYIQQLFDIDDTSYLLNPNGTNTYLNAVKINYLGLATAPNTSGGYRINMGGSIDMNNYSIDYINQLHFNANVRFYDSNDDSYLNYKYGDTNAGGIRFRNGSDTIKGYIYADNSGFGLLDNDGAWALRTQLGTNPLELRCDNNVEFEVHTSYTYSPGSSRAPIFYDSDDTAYYVNPNSGSQSALFKGNLRFNNYGAGIVGLYSASKYQLVFAMGDAYKGAIDGSNVSGGYGLWYSHPNAGGVAANLSNHGLMNIANGTWHASLASSTRASADMRAPLFYDLDDTAYYVNPAGSSRMQNINMTSAGASGLLITHTDIRSAASSNWTGNPGGAGKIQYHSNRWYIVADSSSNRIVQFRRDGTDVSYIDNAGRYIGDVQASTDVRAPIFYDTDDTTYYANPAGNSLMKELDLTAAGNYPLQTSSSQRYMIQARNTGNSTNTNWGWWWYMDTDFDMGFHADGSGDKMNLTRGGSLSATGDMRAPIFYDTDNTGRYINPASTSRIDTLEIASTSNQASPGDRMKIGSDGFIFGGNNSGYQGNSAQISAGYHTSNSLNIVGMGTAASNRRIDFWAEGGFYVSGVIYDKDSTTHYLDPGATGDSLRVAGDVVAYYSSDKRLKDNIKPIDNALDKVCSLSGNTFEWNEISHKETGKSDIGVVAQEVEEVFPEIVNTRDSGYKAVDYQKLSAVLIEAVKELKEEIDQLKKQIK